MELIDRANPQSLVAREGQGVTIEFSDVRPNDFIVICTRNCTYGFQVTDPVEMHGSLMDSAARHNGDEAVLAGMIFRHGRELCTDGARLQTQSRALFVLPNGGAAQKLLTSAIIKLVCIRSVANGLS